MGICKSIVYIDDIELEDLEALPYIKLYSRYKTIKKTRLIHSVAEKEYKFKNKLYWIYFDEMYINKY